jgi:tRNA threonylcarbamoyladenosine biosynthesis protein TsaE
MPTYQSRSSAETIQIASSFASTLRRNDVVALTGELGSGKTQFVKGVCRYFGFQHHVTSPTFVILHRYEGVDRNSEPLLLYHFDLYRIRSSNEIYELGYEEYLGGNGICLIEWAEVLGDLLPSSRIDVRLSLGEGDTDRIIDILDRRSGGAGSNAVRDRKQKARA